MQTKSMKQFLLSITIFFIMILLFAPTAFADTDGTELKITDQPEKLVIQLGPSWAGVEFQLRTDAGVYPAPIVVSPEGLLTMELGGSKIYTLSCINSPVSPPDPQNVTDTEPVFAVESDTQTDADTELPDEENQATPAEPGDAPQASEQTEQNDTAVGIPMTHLLLFLGGMGICVGGLIVMWVLKRRRSRGNGSEDDEYDEG